MSQDIMICPSCNESGMIWYAQYDEWKCKFCLHQEHGFYFITSKDKCKECGKKLNYDIIEDKYEFCNCIENKQTEKPKGYIPLNRDQISLADQFENEIEAIIHKYCGQGMTVGSAIGALQNRIFQVSLNIHLPSIIEVIKRNLK